MFIYEAALFDSANLVSQVLREGLYINYIHIRKNKVDTIKKSPKSFAYFFIAHN